MAAKIFKSLYHKIAFVVLLIVLTNTNTNAQILIEPSFDIDTVETEVKEYYESYLGNLESSGFSFVIEMTSSSAWGGESIGLIGYKDIIWYSFKLQEKMLENLSPINNGKDLIDSLLVSNLFVMDTKLPENQINACKWRTRLVDASTISFTISDITKKRIRLLSIRPKFLA